MIHPNRRTALAGIAALLALPALHRPAAAATAPLPQLTLWGPPAGPSITLVHAIASGLLRPVADKVVFKAWRTPDELRAGLTSGTMQTFVLPTQSAANLFNKGLGVRLVNVMTNGLLYLLSADPSLTSVAALKGRSVAIPFRNDTSEYVFRRLLAAERLTADGDVALHFTGTPMEAIQLLVTGRADTALLPEPAASAAILRAGMAGKTVTRVLDIQRAAIARALAIDPDFIYFDEPFTALDVALKRRMQNLVIEAARGARFGALFITHDLMEAVRIAHRVVVMDAQGRGIAGTRAVPGEPGGRDDGTVYRLVAGFLTDDPLFRHIHDIDERRTP
ncbi:hypothetical protein [Azospirillum argentinense]